MHSDRERCSRYVRSWRCRRPSESVLCRGGSPPEGVCTGVVMQLWCGEVAEMADRMVFVHSNRERGELVRFGCKGEERVFREVGVVGGFRMPGRV